MPDSEVALAVVEIYETAEGLGTSGDIQMPVAIEVCDRHRANGRFRRSPRLGTSEVTLAVVDIDQALTGIAAGINDIVDAGAAKVRNRH